MFYYIANDNGYLATDLDYTSDINRAILVREDKIDTIKAAFEAMGLYSPFSFILKEDAEFYTVSDEPRKCIPRSYLIPSRRTAPSFLAEYRKTEAEAREAYRLEQIESAKRYFKEAKEEMKALGLPVYEIRHNTKRKA